MHPPLRAALQALARAESVTISAALRTLHAVCRPSVGGDEALDWDHVREWAGGAVIGAHYRDDYGLCAQRLSTRRPPC